VRFPTTGDRYVPSADRLFSSLAQVAAKTTIGVILTGMGDDGVEGAKALVNRGGIVIAEGPETAVVYGMPQAAVKAGVVRRSLPLHDIAHYLNDLMRSCGKRAADLASLDGRIGSVYSQAQPEDR
jgi:two-component system chemotaxis response regulator CheB